MRARVFALNFAYTEETKVEIERKFLVKKENLPRNLKQYPRKVIQQGYLCTDPVVRIRQSNDSYYLTYKSKGLLAREFADKNIRVNAICPGYVRTPLVEGMAKQSDPENPERAIQAIADAVPLKRLADPEEVGELAAFLGCYESSYITGTQIVIDGGSTLPETTSMGQ